MQELHKLNFARNQIDSLHAKSFHMLTKLRVLELSENPLEDLPPDAFKDITVSFDAVESTLL